MKTKEKKELLQKSLLELEKLISDARARLFSHKMEKEVGKLSDVRLLGKTRDEIAILATIAQMKRKTGGKHV
ncbi:MAG: 50S ribosomal protein L29 [bacterium]|nr:50S ribosomal protein L29 [bacterium]